MAAYALFLVLPKIVTSPTQAQGSAARTPKRKRMSEQADPEYYELTDVWDRSYQSYSLRNGIYMIPVDEVSLMFCSV